MLVPISNGWLVEVYDRLAWSPMEMTLLLSGTSAPSYIFSASYRNTKNLQMVCGRLVSIVMGVRGQTCFPILVRRERVHGL